MASEEGIAIVEKTEMNGDLNSNINHLQQPPSTSSVNTADMAVTSFGDLSLYVGDLDKSVTDTQLYELFGRVAPVISVRICRDVIQQNSLGYGYVNFSSPDHAATAMEALNYKLVNGKPIRIMHCHRDPSLRKSGKANLFIKNLDSFIDNKLLLDTFAAFGAILSCKVEVDSKGQSKGYGYVQYEQESAAQHAIDRLNGMLLNGKQVYVGHHVRRNERSSCNESPKFTNVYVKNLSQTCTDEDLLRIFSEYGSVTSAVVMKDKSGESRCFGFVNFETHDSAVAAIEKLNDTIHDDKVWFVGRAQRKSEREAELRAKFQEERRSRYEQLQAANLYVKNIDDDIDVEKLKELFSEYGTITSCKILVDAHGTSKGCGFVSFSTPEEASLAKIAMNGKMVGSKPLYVAVAQRKEDRQARLQARFAQQGGMALNPVGMMPGFYPLPPRIVPQPYYISHSSPGMIPQGAGYRFQHQILPGILPGVVPNFVVPYHLQRHEVPVQRSGGNRRGGNHQQQATNHNGGQVSRRSADTKANRRNSHDQVVATQGTVSPVTSMPPLDNTPAGVPVTGNDTSMGSLTSSLAAASLEEQRVMLREHLYPLVERLEPEHAVKVTSMILEIMDQTEVLHLVESPDALMKKVVEAMDILRSSLIQ